MASRGSHQDIRRVVVTGFGPVSPVATGVDAFWSALLAAILGGVLAGGKEGIIGGVAVGGAMIWAAIKLHPSFPLVMSALWVPASFCVWAKK